MIKLFCGFLIGLVVGVGSFVYHDDKQKKDVLYTIQIKYDFNAKYNVDEENIVTNGNTIVIKTNDKAKAEKLGKALCKTWKMLD